MLEALNSAHFGAKVLESGKQFAALAKSAYK
jgi:hypothetical protein